MIRIISLLAVSAVALLSTSCGCKQPIKPPTLRGMPNFKELPSAEAIAGEEVEVVPTK